MGCQSKLVTLVKERKVRNSYLLSWVFTRMGIFTWHDAASRRERAGSEEKEDKAAD